MLLIEQQPGLVSMASQPAGPATDACVCLGPLACPALLGLLSATIIQFHKVSPTASYLMIPYLAWSSYATALTYKIWLDNPDEVRDNSGSKISAPSSVACFDMSGDEEASCGPLLNVIGGGGHFSWDHCAGSSGMPARRLRAIRCAMVHEWLGRVCH
jgi:TspO/MBR family